jgi:hypothetical protein
MDKESAEADDQVYPPKAVVYYWISVLFLATGGRSFRYRSNAKREATVVASDCVAARLL